MNQTDANYHNLWALLCDWARRQHYSPINGEEICAFCRVPKGEIDRTGHEFGCPSYLFTDTSIDKVAACEISRLKHNNAMLSSKVAEISVMYEKTNLLKSRIVNRLELYFEYSFHAFGGSNDCCAICGFEREHPLHVLDFSGYTRSKRWKQGAAFIVLSELQKSKRLSFDSIFALIRLHYDASAKIEDAYDCITYVSECGLIDFDVKDGAEGLVVKLLG